MLKTLRIAQPHGPCAGVWYAEEILDYVLQLHGGPVYCFHRIVHNDDVVREFEELGVIFVDSIDKVPPGSVLVISAHGASPEVFTQAEEKNLDLYDATCPLVTKVHNEAHKRWAEGWSIVLIGHLDHDEILGTRGYAPGRVFIVSSVEDVENLSVPDPARVAYNIQTTWNVDDAKDIVDALKRQYPKIEGPSSEDICYATRDRQGAFKPAAQGVDLAIVIGGPDSSNSRELARVAEQAGAKKVCYIGSVEELSSKLLKEVRSIAITAGASTPEYRFRELITYIKELGVADIEVVAYEGAKQREPAFALPRKLTGRIRIREESARHPIRLITRAASERSSAEGQTKEGKRVRIAD